MKQILFLLAAALLVTGCSTQRAVEPTVIEKVRTDTLRQVINQRDSIYLHDSIFVRQQGDTMTIERWHTRYRDRWRTDTIYRSRVDSVPVPYPVIQEVEADLTWWQQTRLHIANILLMVCGLLAVGWVIRRYLPMKLTPDSKSDIV